MKDFIHQINVAFQSKPALMLVIAKRISKSTATFNGDPITLEDQ